MQSDAAFPDCHDSVIGNDVNHKVHLLFTAAIDFATVFLECLASRRGKACTQLITHLSPIRANKSERKAKLLHVCVHDLDLAQ